MDFPLSPIHVLATFTVQVCDSYYDFVMKQCCVAHKEQAAHEHEIIELVFYQKAGYN